MEDSRDIDGFDRRVLHGAIQLIRMPITILMPNLIIELKARK